MVGGESPLLVQVFHDDRGFDDGSPFVDESGNEATWVDGEPFGRFVVRVLLDVREIDSCNGMIQWLVLLVFNKECMVVLKKGANSIFWSSAFLIRNGWYC